MSIKSIAKKLNNPNLLVDLRIKNALPKTTTTPQKKEPIIAELTSEKRLAQTFDKFSEALSNVCKATINIKK